MKYLELIKGQFTADHEARAKQEEPYVAYSEEAGGVMYTFIPAPVVGPADNEIWYTTVDGEMITIVPDENFANIVEHIKTVNGFKLVFDQSLDGKFLGSGCPAFQNNSNLETIIFPNVDVKISTAFDDCVNLIYVKLPGKCTALDTFAVYNCSKLTSITLPNTITYLGDRIFQDTPIEELYYEGTIDQWNNINKENTWNIYNPFSDPEQYIPATVVHCTDGDVAI